MQLKFSEELERILKHEDYQQVLARWILENTKTGKHILQMQHMQSSIKVVKSEKVNNLMQDFRVIGSILPVLLKLRLLP